MKTCVRAVGAAALICSLSAPLALAYESGDIIVRVGAATVDPTGVSSDQLKLNGATLSNTEVDRVSDATAVGITAVYMFTEYFGLELLAATPFKHNINAKGLEALGINRVGDTKQLPPTLSAQLFPMGFIDSGSRFQPYLGLGLNFTKFFDEETDTEVERGLGAVTGVNEKYSLDLDDSWGIAGQIGFDFSITDQLLFNAAVWRISIETDATLRGKQTRTKVEANDVEIDPWVYMVSLGYRF